MLRRTRRFYRANVPTFYSGPTNFIVIGNSTALPWPASFISGRQAAGHANDTLFNGAIAATRTQAFIDSFASLVAAHTDVTRRNVCLFFEGAQQIDDNYGNYIDGARSPPGHGWSDATAAANGWAKTKEFIDLCHANSPRIDVWVMTLLLWNDGDQVADGVIAGFHATFGLYNANARAEASYCEHVIDVAAITPIFDPDNDGTPPATRPWYDGSQVHNTANGQTELTNRIISLTSSF